MLSVYPAPGPEAGLPVVAAPRVAGARVLVQADEEDVGVVVEAGLCAVAVVDVEVDDRDPADAVGALQMPRGDRDIREQAEAHRAGRLGMVPRRPDRGEGPADGAGQHGVAARQHGAGGKPRRFVAAG